MCSGEEYAPEGDDLLKDAFVDDSEVCPDIDNNNMSIPKDNNLDGTILDQEESSR